ncbi:MAG: hypothetical protein IJB81_01710 [Clostridia bacterium]|nr:hypothetical protein [Clostridia bacterium]
MKKPGSIIGKLYLVFIAVLLLGFLASFLGTPWGYLDFYLRADRHLDRWFDGDARVASISYDFKMKRYLGAAKHKEYPGESFALRIDRRGEEPVMCNYYHLLLWEQELMDRYQPDHSEFTLKFHLPVTGSPSVSPRAPEDYPSIFALKSPGDFLTEISITLSGSVAPEKLYALVMALDATFPQTTITIWQGDAFLQLHWLDRTARESYDDFLELLSKIHPC